jgi:hypothetical protein
MKPTSTEKAKELINKFYDEIDYEIDGYKDDIPRVSKNCALIAVDEIMKILTWHKDIDSGHDPTAIILYEYWEEVKQEINKL